MRTNSKNNNIQKSFFDWNSLLAFSLTSIITGIYRDGFASLFPFLQKEFHLNRAQLGLHSTLFFLTAASFAVYSGQLVDLKGTKWGLVFSGTIMSLFYILHAIAPNFLITLIVAGLTGISVSFNVPSVNKGILERFPEKQRSTALSLHSTALPIGGLLGAIIFPFLGSMLGWRKTMVFPSVVAILGVFFLHYFYQEKRGSNNYFIRDKHNSVHFWESVSQLIKNRELVKISIFGFFLGIISSSINYHFALFLFLDYGLPETISGLGFAIVQLGSILGKAAMGIFCDKVMGSDKRKTFLIMGILFFLITLFLGIGLKKLNNSTNILFLLAFLIGYFGNGWTGVFCASITEVVEENSIGIATGVAFLLVRLGLMTAPPLFGYLADVRNSYDLSWFLLGIIMLIASIGQFLFSKKNNNQLRI